MNITVQIEAETINDFYTNLSELRKNIKKQAKQLKLNPIKDEFPADVDLNDANCYGSHDVTILPD